MMVLRGSCGDRGLGQHVSSRNPEAAFDLFGQHGVRLPDPATFGICGQLMDGSDPETFEGGPVLARNAVLNHPPTNAGLQGHQSPPDVVMEFPRQGVRSGAGSGRPLRLGDYVGVGSHDPNARFSVVRCQQDFCWQQHYVDEMNQTPGERLRELRKSAGLSAADLAERVGRSEGAVRNQENGTNGISAPLAAKYAVALRSTAAFILYGTSGGNTSQTDNLGAKTGLKPVSRDIPVVGIVSAGLWRETGLNAITEASEYIALDVEGYERATLTALKVEGNSMNLHYPAGRYIVVAPVAEAGVRAGDHVVVERRRAGLVEITVKELVIEGDRQALWPRSSDPAFKTPIYITGDEHDQDAPQIIAVVVADYGRRMRPPVLFAPVPKTGRS